MDFTNLEDFDKNLDIGAHESTVHDDLDLFRNLKKTGNPELREQLISKKIFIVAPIAKRFKNSSENYEDILQVGYIGLIKAVDNFDPDREVKFITYATHCIMGEIRHYLRDKTESIKRPRWLSQLGREVSEFIETFLQNYERLPAIKEISEQLNISEEGIIEIFKSKKVLRLSDFYEGVSNEVDLNRITSLRYETLKLPIEDRIVVEQGIEKLMSLEKNIIYMFFYKDLTQTQIADKLGLSQKKVSRMLRKTLDKMKKMLFPEKSLL